MLYQIKCVFFDLRNQWIKMLFVLIQLLVSMSLLCYIIQNIIDYGLFEKQMTELTELNNIYMLHNNTDEFRFNQMVNEEEFIHNMLTLDSFINEELALTRYVADTSGMLIFDKSYDVPLSGIIRQQNTQNKMKTLEVTKDFFTVFHFKGNYNLSLVEKAFEEYDETKEEVPIILGSDYKKFYNIDDIIYDDWQKAYRVYGFFDKKSYYIAPDRIESLVYLDDYIIIPAYISENIGGIVAAFQFMSTYYITNDKAQIYRIIDQSTELNLFRFKVLSFKEQCIDIKHLIKERILFNSALLIILLIFTLIGFIGNIIQFISDSTREFSIHLLCGAIESQIVLRIGIQIGFMILLSNIAPFIIFGFCSATVITLGCSLLIGLFILLYPIVKINFQSIIMMLRRHVE